MQIKVSNTRMHEITKRVDLKEKGASVPYQQQVHVAEAKLIFIRYPGDIADCEMFQTEEGKVFINRYDNPFDLAWDYKAVQPILISETEKIHPGDWFLNIDGLWTHNGKVEPEATAKKVLALTEHFSAKHIKAITDDRMRDGDKVLVECENKETVEDGGGCYVAGNMEIIKLNESNHITLHPAEVKMYTEDDMRKAAFTAVLAYGDEWRMPDKKDFNQFFDRYLQKKIK